MSTAEAYAGRGCSVALGVGALEDLLRASTDVSSKGVFEAAIPKHRGLHLHCCPLSRLDSPSVLDLLQHSVSIKLFALACFPMNLM